MVEILLVTNDTNLLFGEQVKGAVPFTMFPSAKGYLSTFVQEYHLVIFSLYKYTFFQLLKGYNNSMR